MITGVASGDTGVRIIIGVTAVVGDVVVVETTTRGGAVVAVVTGTSVYVCWFRVFWVIVNLVE